MTRLKKALDSHEKGVDESEYKKIIEGAVNAVDRENSTHLNADGRGREEIAERIIEFVLDK